MKQILITWLVLCSVVVSAQEFTASANARRIVQNSSVTITFEMSDGEFEGFEPPSFEPFEVIGGPNRSMQTTVINGAMSRSVSYSYELLATKKGNFTIPPARSRVNGKILTSNTVGVEVVEGKSASEIAETDKESFIRLEASTEKAIIGQQITLEYKLYTQQNISGYDLINEPEYDGFFSQELFNYRSAVQREVLNGKEYYTKVLKKVALFPQRTGFFELDPVLATIAVPVAGAKPRGFFNSVPTRKLRVETNPLTLEVTDPPAGAPISFSGAIGKYSIATTILKTRITTDDAFVINMEVKGTGDGKTFTAPQQPAVGGLEYYDPNVKRDEDMSRNGIVSNYKQIEYLVVPQRPGKYVIRPEFTYFDVDSNDYVTLAPKEFNVIVSQGSRSVVNDDRDLSVTGDILPKKDKIKEIKPYQLIFWNWPLYVALLAFIGGVVFVYYKDYKDREYSNLDAATKRRLKADKVAISQLEQAEKYLQAGEDRKFYEEISSTLNRYLGNKYNLANTEFNQSEIEAKLYGHQVDQDLINTYLGLLKTCEMAIFAGQSNFSKGDIYQKAKDLIKSLESR